MRPQLVSDPCELTCESSSDEFHFHVNEPMLPQVHVMIFDILFRYDVSITSERSYMP